MDQPAATTRDVSEPSTPEEPPVRVEIRGAVALLTIDRPKRRNALNPTALDALAAAFRDAAADPSVRCIVLQGAGGHFCAGADLKEMEDSAFDARIAATLDDLSTLPTPTVAAISGACRGLGMQLALACDLRVVDDDATFAIPSARLGLAVNHWTVHRLALTLGTGTARHLLLAAAVLDSDDMYRLGFTQVRGGLDAAMGLAHEIASLAPLAQAAAKVGLAELEREPHGPEYAAAYDAAWASEDFAEGTKAFTDRRAPTFRGR
ncbi:MAG: enoyl-CoA hydratase-related protein [Microthrixaceae bacterium]